MEACKNKSIIFPYPCTFSDTEVKREKQKEKAKTKNFSPEA